METKWKTCFLMAICKSYGFVYCKNKDYSADFAAGSIELENYLKVCDLFKDIGGAITIRNRLAHGQWEIQFNSKNTAIKRYDFLTDYDNIQKLEILKQCFNEIAEAISAYVTYKDKRNPNFDQMIQKKIQSILNKKIRIQRSNYQKYALRLGKRFEHQQNNYRDLEVD